jgi:hypothetical protein
MCSAHVTPILDSDSKLSCFCCSARATRRALSGSFWVQLCGAEQCAHKGFLVLKQWVQSELPDSTAEITYPHERNAAHD